MSYTFVVVDNLGAPGARGPRGPGARAPMAQLLISHWKSLVSADKEDLYRSTRWTPTSLLSTGTTTSPSRSLLSIVLFVVNVFARVTGLLIRFQKLTERVYPVSQCGFRAERLTVGVAFSVRQLQDECREQQMPLLAAFIELVRRLTCSAETAYLRFSQISVSIPNSGTWSSPHRRERNSAVQRQLLQAIPRS